MSDDFYKARISELEKELAQAQKDLELFKEDLVKWIGINKEINYDYFGPASVEMFAAELITFINNNGEK